MSRRRTARASVRAVLAACLVAATAACSTGEASSPPASAPSGSTATAGSTPSPTAGSTPSPTAGSTASGAGELVVMTHDSFALSEELIARFERENGLELRILTSGDVGTMVNQAILSRDAPLADVLYGIDNTFLSRALDAGIFVPYDSPRLRVVPDELELDARGRVTPIDYGDVCLNYDRAGLRERGLEPPTDLDALTDERYRGLLVVEDPANSSPGLAFLLATVERYGDEGERTWRDYWGDLRANEVHVSPDWEDAYYGRFSGGSGEGDRPIVVSYASSPVAEVVFADPPPEEAPTGVVLDGCFRQVEFAGILEGTDAEPAARAFIDFLLSVGVQEDIPLNMFVFPAAADATLPEPFVEHAGIADDPVTLPHEEIGRHRERWIAEWTEVVIR